MMVYLPEFKDDFYVDADMVASIFPIAFKTTGERCNYGYAIETIATIHQSKEYVDEARMKEDFTIAKNRLMKLKKQPKWLK